MRKMSEQIMGLQEEMLALHTQIKLLQAQERYLETELAYQRIMLEQELQDIEIYESIFCC